MAFDGNEGEVVSLEDAESWLINWSTENPDEEEVRAHTVGVNKVNSILNQTGCVGIRIYYAIEDGKKSLVLVGVNADEEDLENGVIVERIRPCPPYCGTTGVLAGAWRNI